MSGTCSVCLEPYQRSSNPPLICNPCGHVACKPCLETWFTTNRRSCPECRSNVTTTILNRSLMDLLENPTNSDPIPNRTPDIFKILQNSTKSGELIYDKCQYAIYVIDNSGSMDYTLDGKIFTLYANGSIKKVTNVVRWEEAVSKTLQIAEYNIKRNICASYYLLNPRKSNKWIENEDYMIIDPTNQVDYQILDDLKHHLLSISNIRGTTPLDKITRYFGDNLETIIKPSHPDSDYNLDIPICFNIITDGEPDNRPQFELQLKRLCKKYRIFLVINLCTDTDETIEYYNALDRTLGNDLSGFDTLDDYYSEAVEVYQSGNSFVTYTLPIHICRMAGCYSVIADWLDEIEFQPHYAAKLISEVYRCTIVSCDLLTSDDIESLELVNSKTGLVYDIRTQRYTKAININKLRYLYYKHYVIKKLKLPNYRFLLEGLLIGLILVLYRLFGYVFR